LLRTHRGQSLAFRYNHLYQARNLDWSAYLALAHHDGPALYFEGDLLVPPSLIRQVAASEADICLALDSTIREKPADTLVLSSAGKVARLLFVEHGGNMRSSDPSELGELICFLRLSERARRFVVKRLERESFVGDMQLYNILEAAFAAFDTHYVDAAGRSWVEIDNLEDLERAGRIAESIMLA
jgi:choline kinase